jgi:uncharacterized protein
MGAFAGVTCPICQKEARPRLENAAFPFCSPQCKLVDLGRWLDGSYRVPGPPVESTNDAEAIASRAANHDVTTDKEDE